MDNYLIDVQEVGSVGNRNLDLEDFKSRPFTAKNAQFRNKRLSKFKG